MAKANRTLQIKSKCKKASLSTDRNESEVTTAFDDTIDNYLVIIDKG
jgi:hypothetical protein